MQYVMKRLRLRGKKLKLLGFREYTSQMLQAIVDEFLPLDDKKDIMRKVTLTDRERKSKQLLVSDTVHQIIQRLHHMEQTKEFVSLNFLRKQLIERNSERATDFSDALTDCLEYGILIKGQVENPNDKNNPTTTCRLNSKNEVVRQILHKETD